MSPHTVCTGNHRGAAWGQPNAGLFPTHKVHCPELDGDQPKDAKWRLDLGARLVPELIGCDKLLWSGTMCQAWAMGDWP